MGNAYIIGPQVMLMLLALILTLMTTVLRHTPDYQMVERQLDLKKDKLNI